jgi:hypothetical protein
MMIDECLIAIDDDDRRVILRRIHHWLLMTINVRMIDEEENMVLEKMNSVVW